MPIIYYWHTPDSVRFLTHACIYLKNYTSEEVIDTLII